MDPVDDNKNYKFGVFYYNPADERILVPKKVRASGFTVNFAHKESIFYLIAIVLVIIIIATIASGILP
jgi:uncharacterized membrane protein